MMEMEACPFVDESEDEYEEAPTASGFHSISDDAVVKPQPAAPQFALSGVGFLAQPVEPPKDEACVTPPPKTGRPLFSPPGPQAGCRTKHFSNKTFFKL